MHCIAALRQLPVDHRPTEVYGCEVWRDLDWMLDTDKVSLPVSSRENIASALVGVFDSQVTGESGTILATPGRRLAHATYSTAHATDIEKGFTLPWT